MTRPGIDRLARALGSARWVDAILVLTGVMLVSVFFASLARGWLSGSGFERFVEVAEEGSKAPAFWRDAMLWVGERGELFGPALGALALGLGILLTLLIARGAVGLLAAFFLGVIWISSFEIPSIWTWQFLFPFAFALCGGLATVPQLLADRPLGERLLGPRPFGELALPARIAIAVISAFLLWWIMVLAREGGADYREAAWQSGLAALILLAGLAFLDRLRPSWSGPSVPDAGGAEERRLARLGRRLEALPWLDVMIVIVGSMMVIQVYADWGAGFYTVEGYRELTAYYADASSAPAFWNTIVGSVSDASAVAMPLQAVLEISLALTLATLLVRPIAALVVCAFMFGLMVSELNVSATASFGAEQPRTWVWELLFVVVAGTFAGLGTLPEFLRSQSLRQRLLGPRLFGSLPIPGRIVIALAAGAALLGIGLAVEFFGGPWQRTSILGGITLAALLTVSALLDERRSPREASPDPPARD